jgi:hypothetical protein
MNRKMMVLLCLVVNAMVALTLSQNHLQVPSLTSAVIDGTQPPVPPPGKANSALLDDGTQPPVPPPGRRSTTLARNDGRSSVSQQATNGARLAALVADGTQPPVPPPGLLAQPMNEQAIEKGA